ncbi:hypothetical protein KIN20_027670 [Parelaphostrongylus tenuis]|uniref:Uncharacterized protein n=1 Tax=Parelaphostrongylus tenuis TaxID=148309 RepID=A0AAD5QZS8_PARTN|nr:hypothetical protein KIN20_027670 [Parelaphostrongylus tenuis]
MAYAGATVSAPVPGIAARKEIAQEFVQRLVMQTLLDVLESQGGRAFLPDTVISAIVDQFTVNISYEPLQCQDVVLNLATDMGICVEMTNGGDMKCETSANIKIDPVTNFTSISEILSTRNIIMVNWPKAMWQSVLNRAIRMLAFGPFGSRFFSASGTIGGNLF